MIGVSCVYVSREFNSAAELFAHVAPLPWSHLRIARQNRKWIAALVWLLNKPQA